jgi:hypothetical protein
MGNPCIAVAGVNFDSPFVAEKISCLVTELLEILDMIAEPTPRIGAHKDRHLGAAELGRDEGWLLQPYFTIRGSLPKTCCWNRKASISDH